jgi:hypothetical protein
MDNNLTIEIRQPNSSSVYANGDWECKLSKAVEINPGDSVTISKSFIDTQEQTDGQIHIEQNINLYLDMYLYTTRWNYTPDFTFDNPGYKADGKDYIWCNHIPTQGSGFIGYTTITSLHLYTTINQGGWGGFTAQFLYLNLDGKQATAYVLIADLFADPHDPTSYDQIVSCEITCKVGGMPNGVASNNLFIQNPKDFDNNKTAQSNVKINSQTTPTQATLIPRVFTKTISLLEGRYTPQELTASLNNKFGANENNNKVFDALNIADTPFMKSSAECLHSTKIYNIVMNSIELFNGSKNVVLSFTTDHLYAINQIVEVANFPVKTIAGINLNTLNGNQTILSYIPSNPAIPQSGELRFAMGLEATSDTTMILNNFATKFSFTNASNIVIINWELGAITPVFVDGDTIKILGLPNETKFGVDLETNFNVNLVISNVNLTNKSFSVTIVTSASALGELDYSFNDNVYIINPASTISPNIQTTEDIYDYRYFIRTDGERYTGYTTPGTQYWIGCNQIDIEFDTETNLFYWKYLHMPLYDADADIVSRIGINTAGGASKPYFHAGKNGGAMFHSLRASLESDGSIYDFWTDKLGFDLTKLCVSYPTTKNVPLGVGNLMIPVFTNIGDGISTISARPDIDSIVVKSSFQTIPSDPSLIISINDLTTEIYASNVTIESLLLKYGFFYIEMQCGFLSEMIGEGHITENIQSIVNRYYSVGSYTMNEGNSIIWTNKGQESIYLNSIKIRILDSNRNLVTFIGPDNTIFVDIIRGLKN